MSRVLKFGGIFLFVILAVVVGVMGYIKTTTTNPVSGEIKLPGLYGPVSITRDQYGVPHIESKVNDKDVMFALGYTHAQDRFWQMEFQRRVAQGTLSEILGPKTLHTDKFLRIIGFYRAAEDGWEHLDAKTKSLITHYTLGVNAFLRQGHLPLPIKLLRYQPKQWTNIDTIAWQKLLAWDLQDTWRQKVLNFNATKNFGLEQLDTIYPKYPANNPTILSTTDLMKSILTRPHTSHYLASNEKTLEAITVSALNQTASMAEHIRKQLHYQNKAGKGSNNWVVSGKLTQSGKPILSNDPHLSLQIPAVWYLAELKGPQLHVIGATIPGIPVVLLGHNDRIAWGATNLAPDVQDLYIESPETKFKVINEVIHVRGKKDVNLKVRISEHGPIITDILPIKSFSKPIALKWTALMQGDTTVKSFMKLSYAKNWNDFVDALREYVTPTQNFIYADVDGNIGYYAPGKIPIRDGWSGALPVASDGQHEWAGYIPFEKLPHIYNPPEGYIVTANNKVAPNNYPYKLTFHWDNPGYRSERINDLIKQSDHLTVDDMKKIQMDSVSYLWKEMKPLLLKTKPVNKDSTKALQLLSEWDGNTSTESVAATLFNRWYSNLHKQLVPKPIVKVTHSNPLFIMQQLKNNGEYCQLISKSKDCAMLLQSTLAQSVRQLRKTFGGDMHAWKWGRVHRMHFTMLALGKAPYLGWIWNRDVATPGGNFTVNVGSYDLNNLEQVFGASYREIIDLSDFDASQYVQTFGQSENPLSRHYSDQLPMWLHGQYIQMSTNEKNWGSVNRLVLAPE